MSQTITIDPVTRLEGHGKITIQLNGQGEVEDAHFHVTQVRGFEKFCRGTAVLRDAQPDGAHLRHLPGLAPDCLGQGLRSHHVGADSAHRRATAAHVESGPDGAVARAELLPSLLARPAAGHGIRSQGCATSSAWRPQGPTWAAPASACAASASTSSNCSATSASIPDGWCPAASPSRWTAAKRDEILAMLPEAYANARLALSGTSRSPTPSSRRSRSLPTSRRTVHEPDQRRRVDRVHRRRAAADRRPGRHHRGRHHRPAASPRSSARPSRPTATPSSPTTSRSAIPRAAIAWVRWRGSTSPSPWARRWRTRSWPSSSNWPRGRC